MIKGRRDIRERLDSRLSSLNWVAHPEWRRYLKELSDGFGCLLTLHYSGSKGTSVSFAVGLMNQEVRDLLLRCGISDGFANLPIISAHQSFLKFPAMLIPDCWIFEYGVDPYDDYFDWIVDCVERAGLNWAKSQCDWELLLEKTGESRRQYGTLFHPAILAKMGRLEEAVAWGKATPDFAKNVEYQRYIAALEEHR